MTILPRHRAQRNWGARIHESAVDGLPLIVLENQLVRLGFLVGKGGDLVEFNYKPCDMDFTFLTRGGIRNPANHHSTLADPVSTFIDYYPGGWQVIFPNAGAPSDSLGASYGQHGEMSALSWDAQIIEDTPDAVAVQLSTRGVKAPFRYERIIRLEANSPTVHIRDVVTNEGGQTVPAMWGQHVAFGGPFLQPGCVITIDGATVHPHNDSIHPEGRRIANEIGTWPHVKGADDSAIDLSVTPERGTKSDIVYLSGFQTPSYVIENPETGLGMEVLWDAAAYPYVWFWQEYGASAGWPWYGDAYIVGLEPNSSFPTNGLRDAIANGTALSFAPGERRESWLSASIVDRLRPEQKG